MSLNFGQLFVMPGCPGCQEQEQKQEHEIASFAYPTFLHPGNQNPNDARQTQIENWVVTIVIEPHNSESIQTHMFRNILSTKHKRRITDLEDRSRSLTLVIPRPPFEIDLKFSFNVDPSSFPAYRRLPIQF